MICIADWARKHVAIARLLVGILHICLILSTIQLVQLLCDAGIHFSFTQSLFSATIGFGIIAFAGFLRRKQQKKIIRVQLQKFRFFLMGICCTLLIGGFFSSHLPVTYSISNRVSAAFTKAEKREKPTYESYTDKKDFYKDLKAYYSTLSKKELKKELRHEIKKIVRISSGTETVVFAFLTGFAMLALLSGIAILSCGLACNGQGALAILVLVGGLTGVILLAIYLGKLFRKDRAKRRAEELKTTG